MKPGKAQGLCVEISQNDLNAIFPNTSKPYFKTKFENKPCL